MSRLTVHLTSSLTHWSYLPVDWSTTTIYGWYPMVGNTNWVPAEHQVGFPWNLDMRVNVPTKLYNLYTSAKRRTRIVDVRFFKPKKSKETEDPGPH